MPNKVGNSIGVGSPKLEDMPNTKFSDFNEDMEDLSGAVDATLINPLKEAWNWATKPRGYAAGLSEISQGIGILADQADYILPTTPFDEYIPDAKTIANFIPGVGNLDTGEYSILDYAGLGLDLVGAGAIADAGKVSKVDLNAVNLNKIDTPDVPAIKEDVITPDVAAIKKSKNKFHLADENVKFSNLHLGADTKKWTEEVTGYFKDRSLDDIKLSDDIFKNMKDRTEISTKFKFKRGKNNVSLSITKNEVPKQIDTKMDPRYSHWSDRMKDEHRNIWEKGHTRYQVEMKLDNVPESARSFGGKGSTIKFDVSSIDVSLNKKQFYVDNFHLFQHRSSIRETMQVFQAAINKLPSNSIIKDDSMTWDSLHLFVSQLANNSDLAKRFKNISFSDARQQSSSGTQSSLATKLKTQYVKHSDGTLARDKDGALIKDLSGMELGRKEARQMLLDIQKKILAKGKVSPNTIKDDFNFKVSPAKGGTNTVTYNKFQIQLHAVTPAIAGLFGFDSWDEMQNFIDSKKNTPKSDEEVRFKQAFGSYPEE